MRGAILLAAMIIGDAINTHAPMSEGNSGKNIMVLFLIFLICDGIEFFYKLSKKDK
jgi:hypothetical protein